MQFLKAALLVAPLASVAQAALKTFNFQVSEGNIAPDGFSRKYTLINGAVPGPLIEVNQGDEVEVIVTNTVAENCTFHFHGIEMFRTPWSDGVPGVSQRPIKQGETFTYRWSATQYGAYWYHSHYRGQIEDGLYGAIIIHPKSSIPKPFSKIAAGEVAALTAAEAKVKPIIIADVTHLHSHEKYDIIKTSEIEISCYDSIVINGKGNVQCLDPEEVAASLTETQEFFLSLVEGAEMTDKSCYPAEVLTAALGGGNLELMPAGIFEGCVPTTGSLETFSVKSNEWVAFNFVGANNFVLASVSIDEHDMWVYAVDGEYINPQKVQAFTLNNGDRVSVMVKPTVAGAFKIRVHGATPPQMITGHAILSVDGVRPRDNNSLSARIPNLDSTSYLTLAGGPIDSSVKFLDFWAATQFNVDGIPATADDFFLFNMRAESSWEWALNETLFDPHSIDTAVYPALFKPDPNEPNEDNDVVMTTTNNTWVDLVFVAAQAPMPPHPIHKHGNKMYWIGSGAGAFTWNSVNEAIAARPELFNLVNPPKLDAVMTPPAETGLAWAAVRYHVTDPGAWAIHCHIHNHVEGGMLALIQDGIEHWPTIPQEYWDALW